MSLSQSKQQNLQLGFRHFKLHQISDSSIARFHHGLAFLGQNWSWGASPEEGGNHCISLRVPAEEGELLPPLLANSSLPLTTHMLLRFSPRKWNFSTVISPLRLIFHSAYCKVRPQLGTICNCLLVSGTWRYQWGTWMLFITNHKGEEKKVIKYIPKSSMEGMCFTLNKAFLVSLAPWRHKPGSSSLKLKRQLVFQSYTGTT